MAEFTALHRLKPIFMVDEMSQKFEPKDVMGLRSRKIMRLSSYNCNKITRNTRVFASASGRRSKSVNENEMNTILDQEAIYDGLLGDPDYESDDLSCFRGLILDISYRIEY
nr:HNH endonuclease [Tanacetum cinerariifolium]